jgi:hypothetical protein
MAVTRTKQGKLTSRASGHGERGHSAVKQAASQGERASPGKPNPEQAAASPEELEARKILERIDRELGALEMRTERLMHQYGL